jgi:sugar lactone lactonase YvrE
MPVRGVFPGPTHGGVAIGHDGLIYASTDNEKGILVFKPDGTLLKTIAPECKGCHSLILREENGKEFLYAAHLLGNRAVKLTTDGKLVWEIKAPMESGLYDSPDAPVIPPPSNSLCPYSGKPVDPALSAMVKGVKVCFCCAKCLAKFQSHPEEQASVIAKLGLKAPPSRRVLKPTSVTVAPDGSVFVADGYGASVIHRYSPEQKYLGTIKEAGGMILKCPHSVVVDTRTPTPTLMVCDRANKRIIRLALDGTFMGEIAKDLPLPSTLSVFGDKTAVTELQGRVDILNDKGAVISTLGENLNKKQGGNFGVPPESWQEGVFTAPHGICFDANGNLYVTDWNRWGRITRLNRLAPGKPSS